jgi:outer membrane protein TolC
MKNSKSSHRHTTRYTFLAVTVALLLSGCAISPKPVTQDERISTVKQDRDLMYVDQPPIENKLTLEEAFERTLTYNLEHRLKLMEESMAMGQIDVAKFDMLPRLVAAAGYFDRNNYLVSDSMNVDSKQIVLGNTTSQEKQRTTLDLTFTWNALDFGVSYYQAQQQADRSLIMNERRRKAVHTLLQQARHAYWLAVGSEALEGKVEPLLKQVRQGLRDAERVEQEKLRPPLETLNYRKALLDVVRQLEAMRDELAQAKPRLAALMNLKPGTRFELAIPSNLELPKTHLSLEAMEEKALLQRPELFEADLQERISVNETKKALVRMLPGVEIFAGPHYDSNRFLKNQNWHDIGARVTWNLFNVFSGPKQRELAQAQVEINRMQRLAMNMAILTQVHVAWQDYNGRLRQYELSQQMFEIDQKIHQHTQAAAQNDAQSRLNEIRSGISALMAEYRRYQNYAAMQSTYGQLIATLGEDPEITPKSREATMTKPGEPG